MCAIWCVRMRTPHVQCVITSASCIYVTADTMDSDVMKCPFKRRAETTQLRWPIWERMGIENYLRSKGEDRLKKSFQKLSEAKIITIWNCIVKESMSYQFDFGEGKNERLFSLLCFDVGLPCMTHPAHAAEFERFWPYLAQRYHRHTSSASTMSSRGGMSGPRKKLVASYTGPLRTQQEKKPPPEVSYADTGADCAEVEEWVNRWVYDEGAAAGSSAAGLCTRGSR
jgi:hypothetical protein